MRILIVHNHYQDFGGEDVVFEQERKLLAQRPNTSISTLTFRNKKGIAGLWQFLLSPWNFLASEQLKHKIREFKPDIIHFHNTQYACGPLLIRTAKKMGIPVVMTLHNFRLLCPSATLFHEGKIFTDSLHQNFPWTAVGKRVLDKSLLKTFWTALSYWLHRRIGTWNMVDKYLVLADFSKKVFVESTLGVQSEKFAVKPNIVVQQPNTTQTSSHAEKHFLYVGRLAEEKGLLPLLSALQGTSLELRVAGTGPLQEKAKQYAAKNRNIKLLGQLRSEDIAQELSRCTGLIVPSICMEGGVPLSAIEGFLHRVVVIANALGAMDEEIKNGVNGFKLDIHDREDLSNTLQKVLNFAPEERTKMTETAYESAIRKYNADHVLNILVSVYKELTNRNP